MDAGMDVNSLSQRDFFEVEKLPENQEDLKMEVLMTKVQSLMDKITANPRNPSPIVLHALSAILERDLRYMKERDHSSTNNAGHITTLIQGNGELCQLITSKFLTDSRCPVAAQAAAARLLLSCPLTWTIGTQFLRIIQDGELDNIRGWVMHEMSEMPDADLNWKHETRRKKLEYEVLRTYTIGLLAVCLADGGQLVKDVLRAGLSAKLMRCLPIRDLSKANTSQRETNSLIESKRASTIADLNAKPPDSMVLEGAAYEAEADSEGACYIRDTHESKAKPGENSHREEDFNENLREDSSRQRITREFCRSRGKGKCNEGVSENEQDLISSGSKSRSGQLRSWKERSAARNQDLRTTADPKKGLSRNNVDSSVLERERDDDDDCYEECKVGSMDISDFIKRSVTATEAEARAANAPAAVIREAGAAAAEVVKIAALKEYINTNDEEAAVLVASMATTTITDAASAVILSRNLNNVLGDSDHSKTEAPEIDEDIGGFFTMNFYSLEKLREKFCIRCLVILGEHVESLDPLLHENGVDVCLGLLQRFKNKELPSAMLLLPDILKLVSTLATRRKFAVLFVDRGGMERLLAVPRNAQTYAGLSSCLFAIGSVQGVIRRVCSLPSYVVHQVVELAFELLECRQDEARKNATLFLDAAFVFRVFIDAFDALDGLQKLLNPLHAVAVPPNNQLPAEATTSSEKPIAYHTCVALCRYIRAHLLLHVDSISSTNNFCSAPQNISNTRAAYNPLDISNEALDAVFCQIQKDRKLGPAFVRACWPIIVKFLSLNGHITMLELCQASPEEHHLHDLLQYALCVLHIVTLVPYSHKLILNATLSNDRTGIAVILDAVNLPDYIKPEIVEPALCVLINLVCPPSSIIDKPKATMQGQQSSANQTVDALDINAHRNILESAINIPNQNQPLERSGRPSVVVSTSSVGTISTRASASTVVSGLYGDDCLGAGAICAGSAAQQEEGYRQTIEVVRANNGIKALLQLLQPQIAISPAALERLRALTCWVLLGLARDDTIAHILAKLHVRERLLELIQNSESKNLGSEHNRWQVELAQVSIELIEVVTNSGHASTPAVSAAATPSPTLRSIERAAIAAATSISYDSRELLLLIHEHLQASGLAETAASLLKEAQLTTLQVQIQRPSGRAPSGFFLGKPKVSKYQKSSSLRCSATFSAPKNKQLVCSTTHGHSKIETKLQDSLATSNSKIKAMHYLASDNARDPPTSTLKSGANLDIQIRTPIVLPMKRKFKDWKEIVDVSSVERLGTGENTDEYQFTGAQMGRTSSSPQGLLSDLQPSGSKQQTLDSLVVQWLRYQHQQCSTPIATLPPFSLLHPHVCPEPRERLDAPSNVTARLSTREVTSVYGGIRGKSKNRQFVYSRFGLRRTCRDNARSFFTCVAFLEDSSQIAVGCYTHKLKVFDNKNSCVSESSGICHTSPVTRLQSHFIYETLLLSSSKNEVCLWYGSSVSDGPVHSFDGITSAQFSNSGTQFAALQSDSSYSEILLFDIETFKMNLRLTANLNTNRLSHHASVDSQVHFSPSEGMLLYDGVLWDSRDSNPIHYFEKFTDYGGGGFHPAGNEVIINSEVWDLRNFKLLRSVPSLHQTEITFNASGDVIYAIPRRHREDLTSECRRRNNIISTFRAVDAVNYSDIGAISVDRIVLYFAVAPTDSFVGLVLVDDFREWQSSVRIYEVGRTSDDDPERHERDHKDTRDGVNSVQEMNQNRSWNRNGDSDVDSETDHMSNNDRTGNNLDGREDDDGGEFTVDGDDSDEITSDEEDDEDESELFMSNSDEDFLIR